MDKLIEQSNKEKIQGIAFQNVTFHGPVPPPEILRGLEEIYPGASKEFFEALKKQSEHRMRMETTAQRLKGEELQLRKLNMVGILKQNSRNVWLAFILVITILSCGTCLIFAGFSLIGMGVIVTTSASVVIAFLGNAKDFRKQEV